MSASKRVVITGMGAVTPLANNVPGTWQALKEGKSGVSSITIFDASAFPTRIAGEVKNFHLAKRFSCKPEYEFLGRNSRFALEAALEALMDSKINTASIEPHRFGLYFGAGDGGFDFREYSRIVMESSGQGQSALEVERFVSLSRQKISSLELIEQEPSTVVYHLADEFAIRGNIFNSLTACAASSQAIGEAFELIRSGEQDLMLTGGTHSMIHPLGVAGFNLLTALSTHNDIPQRASKPFDKDRDGFVLSEGSAVLVLEELEHALARGAVIHAEIVGYGLSADAFRMTDPHSEARGAASAIANCLKSANMKATDIDYINAHGTSTQLNDQVETLAIKQVFGEHAYRVPVSSIKSMLGHMIAAAGATELIASVLTIKEGIIPPTINYQTADDSCDLDYVPNKARDQKVEAVLSNSFGFGGQNVSLIVKKFER